MPHINMEFLSRNLSRTTVGLTRTSGFLSLLGSSVILYVVFSDRRNKLQRIHYRLLVGICCTDAIISICYIIATAAIPKDTPEIYHLYGNIGTETTCKAQGFFFQWGTLGLPFYMASLSLYYLLVIRYKMKDEDISRRIEPIMHCVSTLIPFALAVAGLCLNLYHHKLVTCWIEAKPWGCTTKQEIECEVAGNAPIYEIWFAGAWILAVFIFQIVAMCLIYVTVRNQERRLSAFAFRSSRNGRVLSESSTRASTETKDTAIQACLYIFGFLLTYVWPFGSYIMARFGKPPSRPFFLTIWFFVPLLGFWNFVAYIRPRYARISRDNRDKSFFWTLKATVFAPKEETRENPNRDARQFRTQRRATIARTENIVQDCPIKRVMKRSVSMLMITSKQQSNPRLFDLPNKSREVIIPMSIDPSASLRPDPIPAYSLKTEISECVSKNALVSYDPSNNIGLDPDSHSSTGMNVTSTEREEDPMGGSCVDVNPCPPRRMSLVAIITNDVYEEDSEYDSEHS